MARFVRLTLVHVRSEGTVRWVNGDRIVEIWDAEPGGAYVTVAGGENLQVQETAQQIVDDLNAAG